MTTNPDNDPRSFEEKEKDRDNIYRSLFSRERKRDKNYRIKRPVLEVKDSMAPKVCKDINGRILYPGMYVWYNAHLCQVSQARRNIVYLIVTVPSEDFRETIYMQRCIERGSSAGCWQRLSAGPPKPIWNDSRLNKPDFAPLRRGLKSFEIDFS